MIDDLLLYAFSFWHHSVLLGMLENLCVSFYCLTGTIPHGPQNQQVLDRLQVERDRGITVKAQTASLIHQHNGQTYLLNLIDTPVCFLDTVNML